MLEFYPPILHLTEVLREIKDFNYLLQSVSPILENLLKEIYFYEKELHISTCSLATISIWESIYQLVPKYEDNLLLRRKRIQNLLLEQIPFTMHYLINQLSIICGNQLFTLSHDYDTYGLSIALPLSNKHLMEDITLFLRRILPCNLVLTLSLMFNTHQDFRNISHQQLSKQTHHTLREEALHGHINHLSQPS